MSVPVHKVSAARRVVSDPDRYGTFSAHLREAWLTLKEAQGFPVSSRREALLGDPLHHLYRKRGAPLGELENALRRALGPTRAAIRSRGFIPTGGDAA